MIASLSLVALLTVSTSLEANVSPEEWFRRGVEARNDSVAAREYFANAADRIDLASPESALAKARAHFLAGQTPKALAAIHAGLALAPYHRELQGDLLAIRETIRYPESADPRLRVRPDAPRELRHRVSPWEPFALASIFGSLAALGFAKRFTTRPPWASAVIAIGLIGAAFVIGLAIHISRLDSPSPLILANAATLRKGNGESYPPKIADPLPRGAEVRELGRRGGWVRVELAGGATGWLPETAILR